jgi:MHS family proline/betaine transporter-like MFS transporter
MPHQSDVLVASPDAAAGTSAANRRRVVLAATIGNVLEWYDFLIYGFLSLTIARLFFPTGDELSSVLLAVATFGVGLVMRPVGGIVLGVYADLAGRKAALTLTILAMAVGTALIAMAPTYESVGSWAPLLVVLSRLLQGFSCGGELGGATAILVESAPARRRGLYASWQLASQLAAFVLCSCVTLVLALVTTPEQRDAGGWRWAFAVGLLIVPVGIYIRSGIDDPELFLKARRQGADSPLSEAMRDHTRPMITAFGLTALYVVAAYVLMLYMPTFAVRQLQLPFSDALMASTTTGIVCFAICPAIAAASDRIGRKPLLAGSAAAFAILSYPAFDLLVTSPSLSTLVAVQLVFGILMVTYSAPVIVALGELFPTRVRSTSVAFAYNLAVALIAGFAQVIVTWLIAATGKSAGAGFLRDRGRPGEPRSGCQYEGSLPRAAALTPSRSLSRACRGLCSPAPSRF